MNAYRMTPEPLWGSENFRRLMGWSAGAHLLALLMMFFGGAPWSRSPAQSVVFVDVIAAVAPEPAPLAQRKKQVVDEAVVIPKQPKPVAKKKPVKKVAAKPEPKPEPKPPGPSAEELLAQMRERQAASTLVADIRSKHEAQQRSGRAGRVDPLVARYIGQIKACMYSKFTWRDTSRRADLEVRFYLDIDPSGRVLKVELVEGSGNRYLDESAERAIWKCQNFGPPPAHMARQFEFTFVPEGRL